MESIDEVLLEELKEKYRKRLVALRKVRTVTELAIDDIEDLQRTSALWGMQPKFVKSTLNRIRDEEDRAFKELEEVLDL